MHAHHVSHAEHVHGKLCGSDEMVKRVQDDVKDFKDMSGDTHPSPNAKPCSVV